MTVGDVKKQAEHFWANGLSVDETKVSALLVLLIIAFAIAMYKFWIGVDISDKHLSIITILVYAVTGINGLSIVSDFIKYGKNNKGEAPE